MTLFSSTFLSTAINSLTSLFKAQSDDKTATEEASLKRPLLAKDPQPNANAPTSQAPAARVNTTEEKQSVISRLMRMFTWKTNDAKEKEPSANQYHGTKLEQVSEASFNKMSSASKSSSARNASPTPSGAGSSNSSNTEKPVLETFANQILGAQNATREVISGVTENTQSVAQSAQNFFKNLTQGTETDKVPTSGPGANEPGNAPAGAGAEATKNSAASARTYITDPVNRVAVYKTPKTQNQTQTQVTRTTTAALTAQNLNKHAKTLGPAPSSPTESGGKSSTQASSGSKGSGSKEGKASRTSSESKGSGSKEGKASRTSSGSEGSGSKKSTLFYGLRVRATQGHKDFNELHDHQQSVAQELARDAKKVQKVKESMEASLTRSLAEIRKQEKDVPPSYRTSGASSTNKDGVSAQVSWVSAVTKDTGGGRGGGRG